MNGRESLVEAFTRAKAEVERTKELAAELRTLAREDRAASKKRLKAMRRAAALLNLRAIGK